MSKVSAEEQKLDRIIALLERIEELLQPTPVTTYTMPQPNTNSGYSCSMCGSWVPYGTVHTCTQIRPTYGTPTGRSAQGG